MRIERIELDGFGRFTDDAWPLQDGLTVLHGANEAGKTTLLNALRALLFGFEATRDGRTWYPAFAGGRRGGRLVLQTAGGERWAVERHGERGGAGALAVRAPNGNQGGQETLDRLLRGADRDLFNNIFAFGLGELQTFSSLSAEGVRGRIYGAGAGLGGTSAIDLERRLRQQMDGTFLPRGRERPLNQLLVRIEELRGQIADLARQPEEHARAHREREELRRSAVTLRDDVRAARERAARLARLLDVRPAAVELTILTDDLAAGDPALDTMPADGVATLDRRLDALSEAASTLERLDDEIASARSEREAIVPDEPSLAEAERIVAIRDQQATRRAERDRRQELEGTAARHDAAVAEQRARAGGIGEAQLLALDDSIAGVERSRALEQRLVEARSIASEAGRRHRAAGEDLEARERESSPPGAAADLADRLTAVEALDSLRLRRAVAEARAGRRLPPALIIATAAMIAVTAGAAGIALEQAMLGALVGVATAAAWLWIASRTGRPDELEQLDARRRELLAEAGLAPGAGDEEVRSLADHLASQRARAALEEDHRAGLEKRRVDLDLREREASVATAAVEEAEDAWQGWLRSAGLREDLSPEAARQVLAAAGIARRAAAERDHQRRLVATLDAQAAEAAERLDALARSLGEAAPADDAQRDAFVVVAADRLERARETKRRALELDATLERLGARRASAAAVVAEREREVSSHLAALGCRDADELRLRHRAATERRALVVRSRELRALLAGAAGAAEAVDALATAARAADPAELEAALADAREQVDRLEVEEREALNRIGALDAQLRQLEAAEELGARRQELAALEGQAAALSRQWAVRALALRLLEETRSRYERERQPDVIRAAADHFERITGGRYARIVAPPGDHVVRVETEGGEHRSTDELSRGTSEQLYLALRFGLIEEFARHAEPLPVVMDDVLVNFDADRASRAAGAIRELATRHQVLYFTCHAWTAELLDPGGDRTLTLA